MPSMALVSGDLRPEGEREATFTSPTVQICLEQAFSPANHDLVKEVETEAEAQSGKSLGKSPSNESWSPGKKAPARSPTDKGSALDMAGIGQHSLLLPQPYSQLDVLQLLQHLLLVVDTQFSAAATRDVELLTRFADQQEQLSRILRNPTLSSANETGFPVEGAAATSPGYTSGSLPVGFQLQPVVLGNASNFEKATCSDSSPEAGAMEHRTSAATVIDGTLSKKSKLNLSTRRKHGSQTVPPGSNAFQKFAVSAVSYEYFEMVVAALIMGNALVVCCEAQYTGIQVGYDLRYKNYGEQAHKAWPAGETVFNFFDWTFGVLFFFEVVIKCTAFTWKYFLEVWNWLDMACVVAFIVDKIASVTVTTPPQSLRLLRLFRLMRLVRLLRTLEHMDVLYIMVTAIKDMTMILVSAVALLSVMLMSCSLFLTQIMHSTYFKDVTASSLSPAELAKHQELFEYFGTITRCLLSMFELTLGNWPPVTRLLSEELTEWFMLICVAHKLTIGFAVIGVINGVILQETFKVAATDDMIMVKQKRRARDTLRRKMMTLLEALDVSDDGMLDFTEFEIIACQPEVKLWLNSMEIETDDLQTLFKLIDEDHSGFVSSEELVTRVGRLKGAARSIDLLSLKENMRILLDAVPTAHLKHSQVSVDHWRALA